MRCAISRGRNATASNAAARRSKIRRRRRASLAGRPEGAETEDMSGKLAKCPKYTRSPRGLQRGRPWRRSSMRKPGILPCSTSRSRFATIRRACERLLALAPACAESLPVMRQFVTQLDLRGLRRRVLERSAAALPAVRAAARGGSRRPGSSPRLSLRTLSRGTAAVRCDARAGRLPGAARRAGAGPEVRRTAGRRQAVRRTARARRGRLAGQRRPRGPGAAGAARAASA